MAEIKGQWYIVVVVGRAKRGHGQACGSCPPVLSIGSWGGEFKEGSVTRGYYTAWPFHFPKVQLLCFKFPLLSVQELGVWTG